MNIKQNLIGGFLVVSVLFLSKLCLFVPQNLKLRWITVLAPRMTKASLTSSRRGGRTRNQKKPVIIRRHPPSSTPATNQHLMVSATATNVGTLVTTKINGRLQQ